MRLFAIIEEKDKNKVTELYTEIHDGKFKFYGFAVQDGKLTRPSDDCLKAFSLLRLSSNREAIGKKEEYDLVLDRESGLLHYFKDGREDLEKLFMWNGICTDLAELRGYKPYRGKRSKSKKFPFKLFTLTCLDISALILLLFSLSISPIQVQGESVHPRDTITYIFSEDEDKFSHAIEAEDIRNYIYNTSTIPNEEIKEFLWNQELVDDVLPCYRGTYLDIVSKIRHNGLDIQELDGPFVSDDTAGEYRHGHIIYIRNYDPENFDSESNQAKTMGHEYVHLLQTSSGYLYLIETSAELISHEYYMSSSSSHDYYSYGEACKYLRVLMEIVGPEPVWDNVFRQNSTMLDDCIKPYLSEEEFTAFQKIMNKSPYYQKETLKEKYPELETLLNTIYMKKYGASMYDDPMINAILKDLHYDRVYFRKSLIAARDSYYELDQMDFKEAIEQNIIKIYYKVPITYGQFLTDDYPTVSSGETYIEMLCPCDIENTFFTGGKWYGTVEKDGIEYTLKEAERLGFINICFNLILREVPIEEYMEDPQNPCFDVRRYDLSVACSIDKENKIVKFTEPERIFVPKISEKFKSNVMTMS